ncbi:hypothetical protein BZA77DRAFT_240259, partial [Pyronema omphalodes]
MPQRKSRSSLNSLINLTSQPRSPHFPPPRPTTCKQLRLSKSQRSLPWIAQGPAHFLANARVPVPQVTTPPILEEDPIRFHVAVRELPTERVLDLELHGPDQGPDQFPGEDLEAAEGVALAEVLARLVSRVLRYVCARASSHSFQKVLTAQLQQIVIEKLTKNVTEDHIREIFSTYGDIKTIDMPVNRQFNTNRGLCYLLYNDAASAHAAIAHMHEGQLDGAVINVSI